jgi:hypothetical protein
MHQRMGAGSTGSKVVEEADGTTPKLGCSSKQRVGNGTDKLFVVPHRLAQSLALGVVERRKHSLERSNDDASPPLGGVEADAAG